jgi:3-phenylpropionate/trans-cinnamate dioxygenase ferredoxin reductase component
MTVSLAIASTVSTAMTAKPIVIVGAGPAAMACARTYREHGGRASVLMVGAEPLLPYRRPPLSKEFLRGELEASELAIEPAQWFADNDVQLQLGTPVSAIDPERRTVTMQGDVLAAEAIVLATGSEPVRDGIAGLDHPAVMTLRTLLDSTRLAERARPGSDVLVLGTGFIGCEIAASLAARGANVTLVGEESLPQARRLGQAAARRIAAWLQQAGVRLEMEVEVKAVRDGRVLELKDGSRLAGDVLVLGLGARPRGGLAEDAGLALSDGAVCVDSRMRVDEIDGRVLAIGDVAAAEHATAGRRLRVEHWGDALEHGKVAGRTLAGADGDWGSVPGFWSTIGGHTLKHAAWGDGYTLAHLVEHGEDAFTVWYVDEEGDVVGVLAHERDEDYERGRQLTDRGGVHA